MNGAWAGRILQKFMSKNLLSGHWCLHKVIAFGSHWCLHKFSRPNKITHSACMAAFAL